MSKEKKANRIIYQVDDSVWKKLKMLALENDVMLPEMLKILVDKFKKN